MDDPESQAARVFVGGVNPDTEEQVLMERFSKHGNVKGKKLLILCFSILKDSCFRTGLVDAILILYFRR